MNGHARICKVAQVSYRQLDYWARTGLLRPSIMEANGSGTSRAYSREDVLALYALGRLSAAGISPNSALPQRVVDAVRERGSLSGEVRDGFLVVDLDALDDPFLVGAA